MAYLILPIISALIAQTMKCFIKSNHRKIDIRNLLAYSGMPSGHSALVVSLVTIIGIKEGWHSPIFALSFVFAVVVIRDAVGLRRYLGQHGKTLNILVKDLKDDEVLDKHYPHLLEQVGHTPTQVLIGSIIGAVISIIGSFFFK
jgi:acid phosphatase family membrane protein YuiD